MMWLQRYRDRVQTSLGNKAMFDTPPTVSFTNPEKACPHDGHPLLVQKTREKTVVTLGIGLFRARETLLHCPVDGTVFPSPELAALTPPGAVFGYDVLERVGRRLFVNHRQVQDIQEELAGENVVVSESEIAYLGHKFLAYLATAHGESRSALKRLFAEQGGYILHLDGTCEEDSPHFIVGLDGRSGLVLASIKIPSEKSEGIIPLLRDIVERYGKPLGVMRDMGKAFEKAKAAVLPDVPDWICHFRPPDIGSATTRRFSRFLWINSA